MGKVRPWQGKPVPTHQRPQRPFHTPIQHDYWYQVAVEPQASPAPIRYGVQNQARRAKRKRYRAMGLQTLQIRRAVLLGNKITLVHQMQPPQGRLKPFKQRANIQRNAPRSFGNRFQMVPRTESPDAMLSEMGL
jgi:hypothetical protein